MIKKNHGRAQRLQMCRKLSAFCASADNFKQMKIIGIPELFIKKTENRLNAPLIFDYRSDLDQEKVKVSLSTNVFSFLLDGTKIITHSRGSATVVLNQFLGLRSGHCLMTERRSSKNIYRSLLFFFDDQSVIDLVVKHKLEIKEEGIKPDFLTLEVDYFIQNFINSLLILNQSYNTIPDVLRQLKLEELLIYLYEVSGPEVIQFFMAPRFSVQDLNFKQVIEGHTEDKLSLEELAFLCHMSLSTFKRKFKQYYGMPPSRWFQKKRLQQAKYLLGIEKHNPSDIYFEVGFENLSSFSQAFKKEYGLTPKQYQLTEH